MAVVKGVFKGFDAWKGAEDEDLGVGVDDGVKGMKKRPGGLLGITRLRRR
jgi:hypothetical protein